MEEKDEKFIQGVKPYLFELGMAWLLECWANANSNVESNVYAYPHEQLDQPRWEGQMKHDKWSVILFVCPTHNPAGS